MGQAKWVGVGPAESKGETKQRRLGGAGDGKGHKAVLAFAGTILSLHPSESLGPQLRSLLLPSSPTPLPGQSAQMALSGPATSLPGCCGAAQPCPETQKILLPHGFPFSHQPQKKEIKHTIKLSLFTLSTLSGFSTFTRLCNHHHHLTPEHSITMERNPMPASSHTLFPPRPPHESTSCAGGLLVLGTQVNGTR